MREKKDAKNQQLKWRTSAIATHIARSKQKMTQTLKFDEKEYGSGEMVEPGAYVDVETGAVIEVKLTDTLPEGHKVIEYRRRFRKIARESLAHRKHEHIAG